MLQALRRILLSALLCATTSWAAVLAGGESVQVTLPAGSALVISGGSGTASVLVPGTSSRLYQLAPSTTTIGPFDADRNVNIVADTEITYSIYTASPAGIAIVQDQGTGAPMAGGSPANQKTDRASGAGISMGWFGDWSLTWKPTVSPAQTITLGRVTTYNNQSTFANSGVGHSVADISWFKQQATADPVLAISHEAKVENEAAGIISTAKAYEGQLSRNDGSITTFTAVSGRVTGNAGSIGTFHSFNAEVDANGGSIGTWIGYRFKNPAGVPGITTKFAVLNEDPDAPVLSAAPVVDQSVTYASPGATGFTVTVPARKQILLMTPGAAYAAGTINFPPKASVADSQTLEVTTSQAVTAVTWGANGAAFVLNGPAGLTAGQTVRFRYFAAIDWWVRI